MICRSYGAGRNSGNGNYKDFGSYGAAVLGVLCVSTQGYAALGAEATGTRQTAAGAVCFADTWS